MPRRRPRDRELGLLAIGFAFLTLATLTRSLAPSARLGQWSSPEKLWSLALGQWSLVAVWALISLAAHIALNRILPKRDPLLLALALFMTGWGILEIARLAPAFGWRQVVWLTVGVAALIGIALLPGDLRWLRRYRYLWLTSALLLTGLTLVLGINPAGGNQRLWLGCCGVYFQPTEALKLLLVVFLAAYLADKRELILQTSGVRHQASGDNHTADNPSPIRNSQSAIRNWSYVTTSLKRMRSGIRNSSFPYLAPLLVMWGFSMLIVVFQRDLGGGSLLFAVFLGMLYLATGQWLYLAAGGVLLIVGGIIGNALFDVVRLRVDAWINPWADPSGRSFQIVQSLIAIAAGGVFGSGFGSGSPTLIPVVHSDFVYAAVAEEWGLIGALAVIALCLLLAARGFRVAALGRGPFRTLLAAGLASLFAVQSAIIVGGVIKALPLTGVTLPFLSYGGSSLLANFILVGLLLKLSNETSAQGE